MKWIRILAILCLVGFFLSLNKPEAKDISNNNGSYKDGELLVRFKKGTMGITKSATHRLYKAKVKKRYGFVNIEHIELEEGMTVEKALALYKNDPDVEYAEPNYIVKKAVTPIIPNDSNYSQQWHHRNIESEKAWGLSTGSSSVIVAVIDTGVDYNHPDLKDNIWINSGETCDDKSDNDNNGYIDDCFGWNFFSNNADPMDDDISGAGSHGTHVAGIIGAIGNNSFGVAGISWQVKIMPLKVLASNGEGDVGDVIEAINYAKNKGAHIINLSLETNKYSQSLRDAIEGAADRLFVVAAGNGGVNLNSANVYPASFNLRNIIAVAATDNYDNKASFSNYGTNVVHLSAPGVNIYSTKSKKTIESNGKFENYSSAFFHETGTSMAAPMVSGTAALISSLNPSYSNSQVRELILASVDKKFLSVITRGRLNVFRALSSKIDKIPPAPPSRLKVENSKDGFKISWVDESEIESQYRIERKLNSSYESIATLSANSTSYKDNLILEEGTVSYRVYAENLNGSSYNEFTYNVPLIPPTNLRFVKRSNGIELFWEDNSSKEVGYEIERRDSYSSYWAIATVGENATSYLDTSADLNKVYYYRVRAYSNSNSSPYSNEVSTESYSTKKSYCFVSTYLFGKDHTYTLKLKSIRDKYLLTNFFGRAFVSIYYEISPHFVAFAENKPYIRGIIKVILVPFAYLIYYPSFGLIFIFATFLLVYAFKKGKKAK